MKHGVILMGASVCGIVGYIIYLIFKKEDDDNDDDNSNFRFKRSNFKTFELKIPKEKVRSLIGRNGKNIKSLQLESNTRISFKNEEEGDIRTCIIKGTGESCAMAHNLIEEFFSKQPNVESFEMEVLQSCVGRIIGRCGEQITEMSTRSGARIIVDDNRDRSALTVKIVIKGSKQQIDLAKALIQRVVEKSMEIDAMLARREPRLSPKIESPKTESMSPFLGQNDSQCEVYVSAMLDPSHFWVQIVGPKAPKLDQLVEEMTEYYSREENKEQHAFESIEAGDLVAAQFHFDKKWYRAEVLNLVSNEGSRPAVELYYLDYGDTDIIPSRDAYELRTDFLRLNFQAIECYLAGVEPNGDDWSEESLDKFEEWAHVAQWKKLSAKMKGYCVREKTRAKREGSPVPGIELYDVINDKDVDIAQELVNHGFAVYKKDAELKQASSRTTSNSNISVDSN